LMNKSEGLQIAFAGQRCFQTGESPDERLLYCPDISPPRNPIVKKNDPRVVTSTELGRFFAPAPGTSAGNR